jgi:hypothetical protein
MYYDDRYSNQGRLSFSSVALLIIFVSAFALILTAIIWRPWADDEPALAPVAADQQGPPAPGDVAAADPNAVAPDAAAEVVSGP